MKTLEEYVKTTCLDESPHDEGIHVCGKPKGHEGLHLCASTTCKKEVYGTW